MLRTKSSSLWNRYTTILSKCASRNIESEKSWENTELYDKKAVELAQKLEANFAEFEEFANPEIMAGAPTA